MSISTGSECKYSTSQVTQAKDSNAKPYTAKAFAQDKTPIEYFEQDSIRVYVSDAEAKVIANKAKKAGLSINEYMRHAALGFPMS